MPTNHSSDNDRETPEEDPDCPPQSSNPIGYAGGVISLEETDFSWEGYGFSWEHRRSYANVLKGGTEAGEIGHHWFLTDTPFLVFGTDGSDQTVSVIRGAWNSVWFIEDGSGGWENRYGGHYELTHNTAAREFTLTHSDGRKEIFHDNDGGLSQSLRGRLKGIESAGGASATLTYNLDDELETVSWTGTDGGEAEFGYTYYDDLERLGLLETASLKVNGAVIRLAEYDYYGVGSDDGPLRTLKSAEVKGKDEGQWERISKQWYRYYTDDTGTGAKYGLRVLLGDEGVEAAEAAGIDLDTATDTELTPYASHLFEYDYANSGARVTKETVRGGADEFSFSWLDAATEPAFTATNTWARKCVETRPDGTTMTVYTNRGGAKILSILEETSSGDKWYDYYTYDSRYRVLEHASSEAVDTVSEPASASGTLTVTLKTNEGRIDINTYYAADDFPNGEVAGYLKTVGVKDGSGGTETVLRKRLYDTQTVGSISIHPLQESYVYMTAGQPDNEASKTSYARTWHTDGLGTDTFQVEQLTTTQPVVATSEHGTGEDEETDEVYDENGFNTWSRSARGIITHRVFDEATGAVSRIVNDADPSLYADAPAGWVAPSFGGANLVTDIVNDRLGRPVRRLGPAHTAVVDEGESEGCESAGVTAKTVRTVDYNVYLCPRHQTWSAKGYVSDYGTPNEAWHLIGPVQIEQRDAGGDTIDVISAVATCECGPLSVGSFGELDAVTKLPQREHWCRWTATERDLWGRQTGQRRYYAIPLQGDGFVNENYYQTTTAYDAMNRVEQAEAGDGTITWTVYAPTDWVTETWVGTDSTGASASDPGNGGADGNNLKAVELRQYDGGSDSGNGNLTKRTLPVDDAAANDRVTDYSYDYRNRRTQAETSDGTTTFLAVTEYDNADNPTSETGYHGSVADANRISRKETSYDARSRVYEEKTYGVNPSNGNLTNALTAGTWYDPDGNVIESTPGGSNGAQKDEYDGLNRNTVTYTVVPGTPPTGQPVNDVTNDVVVEQVETTYNDANLAVTSVSRQRLPDAAGNGALGGPTGAQPQARVYYNASYYDAIGRGRAEANYGTNGGATLTRPEAPADPSDTVLVGETAYNPEGYVSVTTAPDGVSARTEYDQLGRQIVSVEACGTDAERTQRYRWHASGQMENLILENPDTGEQVTTWLFGSTLSDSEVARNDLIVGKQWPTGESESMTVNRQGETETLTQPNGTVHEYTRNEVGQLLHDAVTTLGSDVDGAVLRISTVYNNRGLADTVTSWDHATPGSGTAVNQIEYDYDAFNLVIADKQEHDGAVDGSTPEVGYTFTDGGSNTLRLTATATPSSKQLDVDYGSANSIDDAFNRTASLKVNGESDNLAEYSYAGLLTPATVAYPLPDATPDTEAELSYLAQAGASGTGDAGDSLTGYDRFGRIVNMPWRDGTSSDVLAQVEYGYDRASRRKWREDLTPDADREHDRFYGYDALGQVIAGALGTLNENRTAIGGVPSESETWTYDETGNWLAYGKSESGTVSVNEARTNNESNQIVTVDGSGAGVSHDLNGNMTLVPTGDGLTGAPRKLVWDAWDRLVEVRQDSNNALIGKYRYDGLTRRTTRELNDGTVYHSYYNRAWRSVEERKDNATTAKEVFYWGARSRWDLVRRDRDTDDNGTLDEKLYCVMDAMDPVALLSNTGSVVERYEYSAFGEVSIMDADYASRASSSYDWTFLFHGEFEDAESGYYNYGYRYYSTEAGRWLSRDPIAEQGGNNLYAFVGNGASTASDQLGNRPIDVAVPHGFKARCTITKPCVCEDDSSRGSCGEARGTATRSNRNRIAAIRMAQKAAENEVGRDKCSQPENCACPEGCVPDSSGPIVIPECDFWEVGSPFTEPPPPIEDPLDPPLDPWWERPWWEERF